MQRIFPLANAANFRELGGYPTEDGRQVKWRKLIRCGSLSYLTAAEEKQILAYGLKYDIDFRSDDETEIYPDTIKEQVIYHNAKVYPFMNSVFKNLGIVASMKLGELNFMEEAYVQMLADPHAQVAYREFFTYLLANDKDGESLAFHCAAGKDRTGVAAFLILNALGAKKQAVMADYLLTNLAYSNDSVEQVNRLLTNTPQNQLADKLNTHLAVIPEGIEIMYKTCEVLAGSVENYLVTKLGLRRADLASLKEIYLEEVD